MGAPPGAFRLTAALIRLIAEAVRWVWERIRTRCTPGP